MKLPISVSCATEEPLLEVVTNDTLAPGRAPECSALDRQLNGYTTGVATDIMLIIGAACWGWGTVQVGERPLNRCHPLVHHGWVHRDTLLLVRAAEPAGGAGRR